MSKSKFVIPTILAAGLVPASSAISADESNHISSEKTLIDDIIQHAQSISELNEFSLAGHRSHQSHQSHASHSSHRSYYMPEPPDPGPGSITQQGEGDIQTVALSGRNENSTPRTSILPKNPMTAKKPRVLKGNTAKFGEIVAKAQLALLSQGYEVGAVSGDLHARTIAAIYKYQRNNGLVPTGKLENDTLNRLGIVVN